MEYKTTYFYDTKLLKYLNIKSYKISLDDLISVLKSKLILKEIKWDTNYIYYINLELAEILHFDVVNNKKYRGMLIKDFVDILKNLNTHCVKKFVKRVTPKNNEKINELII